MKFEAEKFLEHFGVKGMRWGVRRKRGADGRVSDGGHKPSEEHVQSREIRKKPVHAMTNDELSALNKRLQLERSYTELTTKQASVRRGKEKADNILSYGDTAVKAYNIVNSPLAREVKKAMNLPADKRRS